ncbi:MAG: choice-of-anchor Q domain-containing protein, partial [Acidobacteriaceae bacterium]
NNVFKNNIVYIGKYGRAQRSLSGPTQPGVPTVTLDHNLYYFPAGPSAVKWSYNHKDYASFKDYVTATGQDQHSIFADPQFKDPGSQDFHLQNGSPAIGKGAGLGPAVVGSKDLDGAPRASGGKVDIGCYQTHQGR